MVTVLVDEVVLMVFVAAVVDAVDVLGVVVV